jgi:hypothetical protein
MKSKADLKFNLFFCLLSIYRDHSNTNRFIRREGGWVGLGWAGLGLA